MLIGFAKITRDMTERRLMQEQLHQSQKMEAIGQLTGGVAHDFNNLLTVILGNLDKLAQHLPAEQPRWRRWVDQALAASERAANLTQQLLAFSRRQPLKPKPVMINQLVDHWSELIRRTLPESIRHPPDPEDADVGSAVGRCQSAGERTAEPGAQREGRDASRAARSRSKPPVDDTSRRADARLMELKPGDYIVLCMTDTGSRHVGGSAANVRSIRSSPRSRWDRAPVSGSARCSDSSNSPRGTSSSTALPDTARP